MKNGTLGCTSRTVGEEKQLLSDGCLRDAFDLSTHTVLRLPSSQQGYREVGIYVARLLKARPGALAHYVVQRERNLNKYGCEDEDEDCGENGCPDYREDGDGDEFKCDVATGQCLVAFEFEGKQLWMWKRMESPALADPCGGVEKFAEILLFSPGRDSIELLQRFVEKAHFEVNSVTPKEKTFRLYRWRKKQCYWHCYGEQPGRDSDTLILPGDKCKEILGDIREFLSKDTRKWFLAHGIPYKRSLLLYGPPGAGKSSMVRLMASEFRRAVCYLQPSELSDCALADAMEALPKNAILVLEDIDALFVAGRSSTVKSKLTFSGVLNVLDGLISPQNGQVIVMTTNHPEKLDPAMVRSGRIDKRYELPAPSEEQIRKMFLSFYPNAASSDRGLECATQFAMQCLSAAEDMPEALSMAAVQGLFILGRTLSYEEFLTSLPELFELQNETLKMTEPQPASTPDGTEEDMGGEGMDENENENENENEDEDEDEDDEETDDEGTDRSESPY